MRPDDPRYTRYAGPFANRSLGLRGKKERARCDIDHCGQGNAKAEQPNKAAKRSKITCISRGWPHPLPAYIHSGCLILIQKPGAMKDLFHRSRFNRRKRSLPLCLGKKGCFLLPICRGQLSSLKPRGRGLLFPIWQ